MIETFPRPFTPQERDHLQRLLQETASRSGSIFGAIIAFAATEFTASYVVSFIPGIAQIADWIALILATLACLLTYRRIQGGERRMRAAAIYRSELAAGVAYVSRYHAVDAIAIAEAEDEGPSYFLRLEDGQVLFLSGQYLYPSAGNAFPSTLFEAVRTPHSGLLLDFQPLGDYLAPTTEHPPFTDADLKRLGTLEDGALLSLPFESLRAR